ncbi:hypothetical protein J6590_036434 [Homalodisca vitripennis]|nr:hypothetical protein J6590_036434 [Homalodisca vitripennis]
MWASNNTEGLTASQCTTCSVSVYTYPPSLLSTVHCLPLRRASNNTEGLTASQCTTCSVGVYTTVNRTCGPATIQKDRQPHSALHVA